MDRGRRGCANCCAIFLLSIHKSLIQRQYMRGLWLFCIFAGAVQYFSSLYNVMLYGDIKNIYSNFNHIAIHCCWLKFQPPSIITDHSLNCCKCLQCRISIISIMTSIVTLVPTYSAHLWQWLAISVSNGCHASSWNTPNYSVYLFTNSSK